MKTRMAVGVALSAAFACAWSQQSVPPSWQTQATPPAQAFPLREDGRVPDAPSAAGGAMPSERRIGADTSSAYPSATSEGESGLSVPPVEVRSLRDAPVRPLSPPAPMTRTEPVSVAGITYLCGGVGLDEAEMMKREARNYDLMLTFAAQNGSYLADVNVDIADASGRSLLKTTCGAPMMLVDLPEKASYRIRAETGGHTLSRTVQLRDTRHGKPITLVWPGQPVNPERSSP